MVRTIIKELKDISCLQGLNSYNYQLLQGIHTLKPNAKENPAFFKTHGLGIVMMLSQVLKWKKKGFIQQEYGIVSFHSICTLSNIRVIKCNNLVDNIYSASKPHENKECSIGPQ